MYVPHCPVNTGLCPAALYLAHGQWEANDIGSVPFKPHRSAGGSAGKGGAGGDGGGSGGDDAGVRVPLCACQCAPLPSLVFALIPCCHYLFPVFHPVITFCYSHQML